MQRTLKCPKCRAKCITPELVSHKNQSVICLADHSEAKAANFTDLDFKFRIWSYMAPPRVSGPMSAVDPERLEMVRSMLDGVNREQPLKVRVDSNINVDVLPDGSIRKTTSHIGKNVYPPTTPGNMQSYDPKQVFNSKTNDMTFNPQSLRPTI